MILLIRGHIRDTFDSPQFYELIKSICELHPSTRIFIHTWSIYANNLSWRQIQNDPRIVTKDTVNEYFKDLTAYIQDILIDDDSKIQLIGRTEGLVNTSAPIKGWKNYWYGKYRLVEHVYNKMESKDEMVVTLRFDILKNSNTRTCDSILEFINKNTGKTFHKNVFMTESETTGIDNIYIGNINTLYKLTHYFHTDLDMIIPLFPGLHCQEFLVFRINNRIFNI
jgi:hypothetical protein